jgi:hypothetical protein
MLNGGNVNRINQARGYVYNPNTMTWEAMTQPGTSVPTALTASAPATATVGAASAVVVASNANRKGLVLQNTHTTQAVSFAIGTAAVAGSGITLAPNGVWEMDDRTFTTGEIRAIGSGAGTTIAIQEFV